MYQLRCHVQHQLRCLLRAQSAHHGQKRPALILGQTQLALQSQLAQLLAGNVIDAVINRQMLIPGRIVQAAVQTVQDTVEQALLLAPEQNSIQTLAQLLGKYLIGIGW